MRFELNNTEEDMDSSELKETAYTHRTRDYQPAAKSDHCVTVGLQAITYTCPILIISGHWTDCRTLFSFL